MFVLKLTPEQLGTLEAALFFALGYPELDKEVKAEFEAIQSFVKREAINVHPCKRSLLSRLNLRYAD